MIIVFSILIGGCYEGNKLTLNDKLLVKEFASENNLLKDIKFTGKLSSGNICAYYQEGLDIQAKYIAKLTDEAFRNIEKSSGFKANYNGSTLFLCWSQSNDYRGCQLLMFPRKMGIVFWVQPENDSYESIISHNVKFPFVFIHEIVETSLIFRQKGTQLELGEMSSEDENLNKKIKYNRWFREGFSNYCAYLAHESIISDGNFDINKASWTMILNGMPLHPFSNLDKLGEKIFSWHQFSKFPSSSRVSPNMPTSEEDVLDYYDASFGLFLLIRERFGEGAVRKIIRGIDQLEYADGPALIKLTNEVLNADVRKIVEDFNFPQTGLYIDPLFPGISEIKGLDISEGCQAIFIQPGSPAEKAGIKVNDVIYKINGKDIKANLDFEFAIFHLMNQPSVKVSIWRKGEGFMAKELILAE